MALKRGRKHKKEIKKECEIFIGRIILPLIQNKMIVNHKIVKKYGKK